MAVLTHKQVWRRPRKRRAFELTLEEQVNVSRGLRVIRERCGSWESLARRLGCTPDTLTKAAAIGPGFRSVRTAPSFCS
jgi:hypothetical protein